MQWRPRSARRRGAARTLCLGTAGAVVAWLGIVVLSGCQSSVEPSEPCVFTPFEDTARLRDVLARWVRGEGLGSLRDFGLSVEGQAATLRLAATRWRGVLRIETGARCRALLRVRVVSGPPIPPAGRARLGAAFPVPRRPAGSTAVRVRNAWLGVPAETLVAWGGLALLLLGLARDRWGARRGGLGDGVWVSGLLLGCGALTLVVAWPLVHAPFESDTPFLRAAYARENPFGDWNHPFLSYLLLHPVARLTLSPEALRAVPLGALLLEVGLLGWAATRAGGATAGVLACLWFVAEVPRRHGLDELADWDLAGALLMGMLLVLLRLNWAGSTRAGGAVVGRGGAVAAGESAAGPEGRGLRSRRAVWALAVLCLAGFFASYLFVVPVGVLAGVLWLQARQDGALAPRGRPGRAADARAPALWPLGAAVSLVALWAGWVFLQGRTVGDPRVPLAALLVEVARELPSGRDRGMWVPLLAGLCWLGWCAVRARSASPGGQGAISRPAARFALGVALGVPAAVLVAWAGSHVNGGYYVGLGTPLLLWGAAVASARGIRAALRWAERRAAPGGGGAAPPDGPERSGAGAAWPAPRIAFGVIEALLIAGLFWSTGRLPGYARERRLLPSGAEQLGAFDPAFRAHDLPLVTNSEHLPLYLGVGRIWQGRSPGGPLLPPGGPADVLRRGRWMDGACRPVTHLRGRRVPAWTWTTLERPFYLVLEAPGGRLAACAVALSRACTPLFPVRHWLRYYRCERSARGSVRPNRSAP